MSAEVHDNFSSNLGFLPNLIIAGAPKSGTSSLHTWLADHPDALGSTQKETYYFVDPGTHMYRPEKHIANGLEGYSKFFNGPNLEKPPTVVLESTPSYLYSKTALDNLPDLTGAPKFIFILREPAAQIYSIFNYFKNNWSYIPFDLSFSQYLEEVQTGVGRYKGNELAENALTYAAYVDFLLKWRHRVGPDRLRVWLFDELVTDKKALTKKAAMFVGLDPDFYDSYDFPSENETYAPRSAALQRINVALRNGLPKGKFYKWLRSLYRRLNTTKPNGASEADRALMNELRAKFRVANAHLAEEFDLDLSGWMQQ